MTVKDSVTLAQSSSNAFTVVPADVASFTFSTVSDVTAGALIPSITVSAFDLYGNAATNYDWTKAVVTTTLSTDLHGSSTGCGTNNASACSVPAGTFTPSGTNTGTANLTGLKGFTAESGRKISVKDTLHNATSGSGAFTVTPSTGYVIRFVDGAFNGQPVAFTEYKTTIFHTCAPGGSPCGGSSLPVQVTARDQYGNLVRNNTSITISTNAISGAFSPFASTTTDGVATFGGASFAISVPTLGNTPST